MPPFKLAVVAHSRNLIDLPITVISYVKTAQVIYRYLYRGSKSMDKAFNNTANDTGSVSWAVAETTLAFGIEIEKQKPFMKLMRE